jgi:hypothetical protein
VVISAVDPIEARAVGIGVATVAAHRDIKAPAPDIKAPAPDIKAPAPAAEVAGRRADVLEVAEGDPLWVGREPGSLARAEVARAAAGTERSAGNARSVTTGAVGRRMPAATPVGRRTAGG